MCGKSNGREVSEVEQVKHFHAQLKGNSFFEIGVLQDREVDLRKSRVEILATAHGAVLTLRRILKRGRIKPLHQTSSDTVRNAGIRIDAGYNISAVSKFSITAGVCGCHHGVGLTAVEVQCTIQLPAVG